MIRDLILKNRSYRRYHQNVRIDRDTLVELVDLARLSPTARNAQSLKYYLSTDATLNATIFPRLSWAGYLTDWDGPIEGERPAAYIVVLNDTTIASNYFCDEGIASQSILLGAVEKGFGGCIVASVDRRALHEDLNLPAQLQIVHVIALGKPKEEVVLEPIHGNDIKYWRDRDQKHHVPKRGLDEIIIH